VDQREDKMDRIHGYDCRLGLDSRLEEKLGRDCWFTNHLVQPLINSIQDGSTSRKVLQVL